MGSQSSVITLNRGLLLFHFAIDGLCYLDILRRDLGFSRVSKGF